MNHETVQNVTSKKREGKREEIAHDEMRSRPSGSITLFFPFLFPISNTDLRLTHTIQKRTAGQSPLPIPRSYLFLFEPPSFLITSNSLQLSHSPLTQGNATFKINLWQYGTLLRYSCFTLPFKRALFKCLSINKDPEKEFIIRRSGKAATEEVQE